MTRALASFWSTLGVPKGSSANAKQLVWVGKMQDVSKMSLAELPRRCSLSLLSVFSMECAQHKMATDTTLCRVLRYTSTPLAEADLEQLWTTKATVDERR